MQTSKDRCWTVSVKDAGRSLQDVLAQLGGMSRRVAKQHIDARVVWVNDRCVWMARHRLQRGDVVRLVAEVPSPSARSMRPRSLTVLYEDSDYLVVDKPPGMLANGSDDSAEAVVRQQTANADLRAVHRLDRDTSGCLLMARRPEAFEAAVRMFRQHRISKTYRVLVHGSWDAEATTLALPIEGERALTHVTCLRATRAASHVSVRIETGRTHQIRRHLAMVRHPVLGDRQYGPKELPDPVLQTIARPLLHAVEFRMDHPFREEPLSVFAPLPEDMHRWITRLNLGGRKPSSPGPSGVVHAARRTKGKSPGPGRVSRG